MDIPMNVDVFCSDHRCGASTHLVLNPTTGLVTHLVVKERKFPHTERLVPIKLVTVSTPHRIQLRCTAPELARMEPFIEVEYFEKEHPFFVGPLTMGGFVIHETDTVPVEHEHIPSGEVAVHRGANVEASDGHAGKVDEFLMNPVNGLVTHLVLQEGHLWGRKDITIPVSAIDHIEEDAVYLKLDKQSIEKLPAVSIR